MTMRTIWKFPLQTVDAQVIHMPFGAQVLCLQSQGGAPTIWALVDPAAVLMERMFLTYGTGHQVTSDRAEYVGTYQVNGGALVFHVFAADQL